MPVLFVAKNCVACNMTKKNFERAGVLDRFTIYDVSNDPDGSIAEMTSELKQNYGLAGAPFVDPRDLGLEPFVGFNPDKIKEVIDKLKQLV